MSRLASAGPDDRLQLLTQDPEFMAALTSLVSIAVAQLKERPAGAAETADSAAAPDRAASPGREKYRGGLRGVALERVLAHIEQNLCGPVSLDELARIAGVSRFHFARQFRVSMGESPMEYWRRMRIERAKILLRGDSVSIARVAVMLGFADQSHFTRTFGRMVGVSPRSFAAVLGETRL